MPIRRISGVVLASTCLHHPPPRRHPPGLRTRKRSTGQCEPWHLQTAFWWSATADRVRPRPRASLGPASLARRSPHWARRVQNAPRRRRPSRPLPRLLSNHSPIVRAVDETLTGVTPGDRDRFAGSRVDHTECEIAGSQAMGSPGSGSTTPVCAYRPQILRSFLPSSSTSPHSVSPNIGERSHAFLVPRSSGSSTQCVAP